MIRKWKTFTIIGSATLLCALYTWGIPAIINLPKHKHSIENKILQETGFKVDIGNPEISMGVFPSVWLESNNISVINHDNSKALSIENPRFKLKLLPLLSKKIVISQITASSEIAHFTFTQNKEFLLGDYPLNFKKKDPTFSLEKLAMNLGAYNISLTDNFNNNKIALNGSYLENGEYIQNKQFKFATDGELVINKTATPYFADIEVILPINTFTADKLKVAAKLENFDLKKISPYAEMITKGYIKDLSGQLNIAANTSINAQGKKQIYSNISTSDLKIIGNDKPSSVIFPDKLSFKINFETIANGVNFVDTTIKSNNIDLKLDGQLTDSGKKVPAMNFVVQGKNTRLEQLCKIIPGLPNLLPEMDLYKLKQHIFYGDGDVKLKFVGNGDRPEVFGFAKMRNTYVVEPIPKSPQNASVDLNFLGKVMKIKVFVPTDYGKQHVSLDGFIKIDGSKYSELKIKSTNSIDMAMAQRIVNPLHEIFKFKLGPVPIMELKGLASLDIRSAGTKKSPHLWGVFNFRNATAKFNDIHNLEMKNASGTINFNDTQIPFKTHSATINGKNASVYGTCDTMGKLNVFAQTTGQNIPDILKVINTSDDMVDVQKVIKPFTKADGIADLFLNIYGNAKDVEQIEFNKDLFAKGTITLHNATTVLQDTFLPIRDINGKVNFNKKNADYNVSGYIRKSPLKVLGTATDKYIDLKAYSNKFLITDCFDTFQPELSMPYKNEIGKLYVSINGRYKGIVEENNIDYDKISVDGNILSYTTSDNPINIFSGKYSIKNSTLHADNISGKFYNNPYTLTFTGNNIYDKMNITDATFNLPNFNLATIDNIKENIQLPEELKKLSDNTFNFKGNANINGSIKNGKIWADTNLKDISFIYRPIHSAVKILSGRISIKNDNLYLGNVITNISSMPIYLSGKAMNIFKNPEINMFISGKPNQIFFDRFINNKSVYPVKIKGDIDFSSKIKGTLNHLHTTSELNIKENSSIYFMGATLSGVPSGMTSVDGVSTNPLSIITDIVYTPNNLKINSLKYNQIITSQNKKTSVQNQLTAHGDIYLSKNNIKGFKNLSIKTSEPTDAKIFNILFKKPTIKQGNFVTDLNINGDISTPKVLGKLNITSIDIPILDTTVKDINLDFQKDFIYLDTKGVILTNDICMFAKIANKFLPVISIEDLSLQADTLDLNVIMNRLNDFDADKLRENHHDSKSNPLIIPNQIILKQGIINADKILIKNAQAGNFVSTMQLGEDNVFNVNNFAFDIANGTVNGNLQYNLTNNALNMHMDVTNADAEIIGDTFFDMAGQMYGRVTGKLDAACDGSSSVECLKTVSGEGSFEVKDGRMPKLGSLEYLLKATNLITGGITRLSINSIIDLITPIKSGNFNSIKGDIKVHNGIADNIEIYSSGKELNMYLTGSYNFSNLIADMNVYGSLSKEFTNVLGFIANLSLQRLFNKIPRISINEIKPETSSNINKIPNFDKNNVLRVFKAEIFGDINGTGYVKSFRWIKH